MHKVIGENLQDNVQKKDILCKKHLKSEKNADFVQKLIDKNLMNDIKER